MHIVSSHKHDCCLSHFTGRESIVGHKGQFALPQFNEISISVLAFRGTAGSGRGSNPRIPDLLALNVTTRSQGNRVWALDSANVLR